MAKEINFSDEESVRLYCLDLRQRVADECGLPCEVLTGFDNVLVLFSENHTFQLSAAGHVEKKRGKTIAYASLAEWEQEIIETTKLYKNSGQFRGGHHVWDTVPYYAGN